MSTYKPNFYGIDSAHIEQVTRQARREQSTAIWQMIQGIFPSVSDRPCARDNRDNKDRHVTTAAALNPAAV